VSIIFRELSENATNKRLPEAPQAIAVGQDLLAINSA
jgi:hypothetical protein